MSKLRFDELHTEEKEKYRTITAVPPVSEPSGQLMDPRLARFLLDAVDHRGHHGVDCSTFPGIEQYARPGYLIAISADAAMLQTPHMVPAEPEKFSWWDFGKYLLSSFLEAAAGSDIFGDLRDSTGHPEEGRRRNRQDRPRVSRRS